MNKIEILYNKWLALQPLKDELQQRLDEKFILEFNYNSNHIEGNTLTYGQTELLLKFGEIDGNAKMKDLEDMKAHNLCLQIIKEEAKDKERPLTEYFIRNLHNTMLREDYQETKNGKTYTVHAGIYKTRPNSVITVTGERFEYASVEETPALMSDLITWYNKEEKKKELSIIELATLFHYRYIRIHPFEDGNGRIARLLMNYILLKHDYPMIVIRTKDKQNYLKALYKCDSIVGKIPTDGANANIKQINTFYNYIENIVIHEIETSIEYLTAKDNTFWWFDGEFIKFRSENTSKILELLIQQPNITIRSLSEKIGINKSAIQKQLKTLQDKGFITRISGKTNYWHISISCTTKKGGTKKKKRRYK